MAHLIIRLEDGDDRDLLQHIVDTGMTGAPTLIANGMWRVESIEVGEDWPNG